eukprot:411254-Amphidinium_carterae.1
MEESRKDLHYLPTTVTTGEERKEKETKVSLATTVENQDTQVTSVGGSSKDKSTTWTSHHQCGQYRMTTQHRIYSNHFLSQHQQRYYHRLNSRTLSTSSSTQYG